jgi:hypothetical protein
MVEEVEVVMGDSAEDDGANPVVGNVNPWVCCDEDIGSVFVVDDDDIELCDGNGSEFRDPNRSLKNLQMCASKLNLLLFTYTHSKVGKPFCHCFPPNPIGFFLSIVGIFSGAYDV